MRFLPHNLFYPLALQPPHLLLERLDLPPTVQRSAIIIPQALDNLALGLLYTRIHIGKFLPTFQFLPQLLDIILHRFPSQIP
jgi:hypothetical protein